MRVVVDVDGVVASLVLEDDGGLASQDLELMAHVGEDLLMVDDLEHARAVAGGGEQGDRVEGGAVAGLAVDGVGSVAHVGSSGRWRGAR